MTADRDPEVGALLDRLPVEPAPPGFWDDLRARLESGAVVELPLVARAGRPARDVRLYRRRRIVVAGAAAAAVLVAVVVGAALRDDRDDLDTRPPLTQPDAPTSTVTTPAPSAEQAVLQAARRWVDAVGAGDADGAWALLGQQSQESIGGRAAFDDLMASALREGWGTWEGIEVDALTAFRVGSAAEPRWWFVTFEREVASEEPLPSVDVLGVRLGPDVSDVQVEPFIPGPAIGLIELPTTGAADPELIDVHVDADVDRFVVAVDGVAATDDQLVRADDGAVVGVRPDPALTAGRSHTVTVGVVLPDGSLAADIQTLDVG